MVRTLTKSPQTSIFKTKQPDELTYSLCTVRTSCSPEWANDTFSIHPTTGQITVLDNERVMDWMNGRFVEKDSLENAQKDGDTIESRTVNFEQVSGFSLTITVTDDGGCFGRKARDPTVVCPESFVHPTYGNPSCWQS